LPRKSTLTQQQKNQKRQRATQDQLVTLELEFNKNPTPTAAVRERIAQEINMTERSVQIWFQNRRAKIKMIAKKSIETGEDCDSIPDSMRQYLAMQFDPHKPGARELFGRANGLGGLGHGYSADANSSGKIVIHHFTCRTLSIGTWRRFGQNAMDLVIFYSPDKATMTYYINNDSAGYKIEYPFSYIKNVTLDNGDPTLNANGVPTRPGGLIIELNRPPIFWMDCSNSGGFFQCGDFTEDQQASRIMVHHLGGHPKVLSVQLAKLVSLETFQTRLNFNYSVSAPVTPPQDIHRPASQPNQFTLAQMGLFPDSHLSVNHMPRGHKRQRSRSVPAAVDLSYLQTPIAPFQIQTPVSHMTTPNPNMYAPIPHHPNALQGLGNDLRIDTASTYGVDPRSYPMSATTMSDFAGASPSYYSTAPPSESITMVGNPGNQFSLPYVSPSPMDHSKMMSQSPASMPTFSHVDPLIANHSPPLSNMHNTGSNDMYNFGADQQQGISEDGVVLSEMYSKHNINQFPVDGSSFDFTMPGMAESQSPITGEVSTYDLIQTTSS
jgi:Homeodomain